MFENTNGNAESPLFFEVVRGRVSCKMGGETVADVIVMDATRSVMCFSSKPADLRTYDADEQ